MITKIVLTTSSLIYKSQHELIHHSPQQGAKGANQKDRRDQVQARRGPYHNWRTVHSQGKIGRKKFDTQTNQVASHQSTLHLDAGTLCALRPHTRHQPHPEQELDPKKNRIPDVLPLLR